MTENTEPSSPSHPAPDPEILKSVQVALNGQAGSDIQHLFFRTVLKTVKMQFLCRCQRVHFIAFSGFHVFPFLIPQ